MIIESRKGGWYIIDGPDPIEFKLRKPPTIEFKMGPFLTFLDAYTMLDKLNLNRKAIP
tara:strand:+ start:210 stop:383 length:174 start_codon:yes stop_codon:yes gene_type:complete